MQLPWFFHVELVLGPPCWIRLMVVVVVTACTFWTCVFIIFTSTCASHHNTVHFLNISTSKSAPTLTCFQFSTCVLQMCFAPQRRALFRHPRCQNCSGTFWLPNLLHARTASQRRAIFHLSFGQMAPHLPLWRAYFSTLRSHKALGKHSVSRLFYLFARLDLLSSDFLWACVFCLFFSDSCHLSLLSEFWVLNFLRPGA